MSLSSLPARLRGLRRHGAERAALAQVAMSVAVPTGLGPVAAVRPLVVQCGCAAVGVADCVERFVLADGALSVGERVRRLEVLTPALEAVAGALGGLQAAEAVLNVQYVVTATRDVLDALFVATELVASY